MTAASVLTELGDVANTQDGEIGPLGVNGLVDFTPSLLHGAGWIDRVLRFLDPFIDILTRSLDWTLGFAADEDRERKDHQRCETRDPVDWFLTHSRTFLENASLRHKVTDLTFAAPNHQVKQRSARRRATERPESISPSAADPDRLNRISTTVDPQQAFHRGTAPIVAILSTDQGRKMAHLSVESSLADHVEELAGKSYEEKRG